MRPSSVLPLLCALACAPEAPPLDAAPAEAGLASYWADAKPILDARCVSCHQPGGVAPFTLDTYADAAAVAPLVANAVATGTMPPWFAQPHRDYANDPSLSVEQVQAIVAWADGGAIEGDPADEGLPIERVGGSTLPRVDHRLALPTPYDVSGATPDDYRCFLVDWPADERSFITGFEALPGNPSVVHHIAAFLLRSDGLGADGTISTFEGWDADHDGPGYGCFGGPSATGEDLDAPTLQIAQWLPGSGAVIFPEGTGIEVPAGSKVVLQMHYFTGGVGGEVDDSAIEFMTESTVDRVAAFAPFLDPLWPLAGMDIPAGSTSYEHDTQSDPTGFLALFLAGFDLSAGFDIHSTMMHMHRLGETASLTLHPEAGEAEVLLEVADWDFDWQLDYRFAQPVAFRPGDELEVRCTWSNPGADDVGWGEGSDQEMCVANMYISEPER